MLGEVLLVDVLVLIFMFKDGGWIFVLDVWFFKEGEVVCW